MRVAQVSTEFKLSRIRLPATYEQRTNYLGGMQPDSGVGVPYELIGYGNRRDIRVGRFRSELAARDPALRTSHPKGPLPGFRCSLEAVPLTASGFQVLFWNGWIVQQIPTGAGKASVHL